MMTIHFSITFSAGLQHKYSPAKPNFQKAILLFFLLFFALFLERCITPFEILEVDKASDTT